ncbi:pyridoxal phosphate-dependent transferase [Scenedesmus sp. NREL 46B-D3]|nr:pyridoxal phosphate-dependent transferase [Scenedesmus sp. NREL 46B-D3]
MALRQSARQLLRAAGARSYAAHAARAGEEVTAINEAHKGTSSVMEVPQRLLMGPGPSNAHPRILAAQSLPLLGHMHPPFLKIMDEISDGLRYLFQTDSKYTLMVSGTGHAGMEAAIANLLEPGEKIIVGVNGIWGERVADLSERYQGDVIQLKAEAGKTFSSAELKAAVAQHKPAILFLVQGESSTGTHQALGDGLGEACRAAGTLLVVDTVASLGGVPLFADKWGIDAIYSGSQKCLSGPPGAAPFFLSERALEKLRSRKTKPQTYNLDMNLIGDYWGWFGSRSYHHTGPVSTFYAMREALQIVADEGLEAMWARHLARHQQLWEGLGSLGLQPFVENDADRPAPALPLRRTLLQADYGQHHQGA